MRKGFTLIELVVTIAMMAMMAAVSGLAVASLRPTEGSEAYGALEATRSEAIRTGRPTIFRHGGRQVRFLPDGSSSGGWVRIADVWYTVAPLNGEIRALD